MSHLNQFVEQMRSGYPFPVNLKYKGTPKTEVCDCCCHVSKGDINLHEGVCCEICPYCSERICREVFENHAHRCVRDNPHSLRALEWLHFQSLAA